MIRNKKSVRKQGLTTLMHLFLVLFLQRSVGGGRGGVTSISYFIIMLLIFTIVPLLLSMLLMLPMLDVVVQETARKYCPLASFVVQSKRLGCALYRFARGEQTREAVF